MRTATKRQAAGLALVGTAALAAAVLASPAAVLSRVEALSARPLLFAAVLAALYLVRPVLLWPPAAVAVFVGYTLGVTVGLPVAVVGGVATSLPPYLLARRTGQVGVFGRVARAGRRFFASTGSFRGVLAAKLSPVPADGVSAAAGLSDVRPLPFLTGTAIGQLPWVVAAVLAGASMRTLTLGGADAGLSLGLAAAAVAALLLARPAYERFHREDATPE